MGTIFKYGDHVDTDVIIPARHLNRFEPAHLAAHCMEDMDKDFAGKVQAGDIMVGGRNFGCGSSREHAPLAIQAAGISCVIAESFARIFHRNAINIGLPILESPEAVRGISAGDSVEVDLAEGKIDNLTTGQTFYATPFPPFLSQMIEKGGLVAYVRSELKEGGEGVC